MTLHPPSHSTHWRLKVLRVNNGIPVVLLTENPGPSKASLFPLLQEEFNKGNGEMSVLLDFQAQTLPVLAPCLQAAVFRYTLTDRIMCAISGYPNDYSAGGHGLRSFMG